MSSSIQTDPGEVYSPGATSPATQYPIPSHETAQKTKATSRAAPRRGSTASSAASIGSALETVASGYNPITEVGQNAISTLLQPPIVRTGLQPHPAISTGGFKAPTQRDIPPVALTNIPHIEAKTFHPYIAQVGSLYEAFQRAKQEGDGDAQLFRREKKDAKSEEWEALLSTRGQRPGHSRSGSTSSLTSSLEASQPKRRSNGQRRLHAVSPLSTIPSVYSEEDFHLENPRTFDIVSERSDIVRDPNATPSGRKTLASNAILQEKLSWYMDTVEIHLISSISTASKSFFSALGSLRELHAEAAESVERIQKLRKDLAKLDNEMALGGLKVVNLKQRRDNVRKLAEAIMQLEEVVVAVRSCEDKVESGEIDTALDDIDAVEHMLSGSDQKATGLRVDTGDPGRDLRNIRALQGVTDDLQQLRYRIGKGYETRFHNSFLSDLRRHVGSVSSDATLQRWGVAFNRLKPGQRRAPSTVSAYMSFAPSFRSELEAEMTGLSRAKHTIAAATTFRALVLREMKNVIRKELPSSNEDDNVSIISASTVGGKQKSQQEKSSALARNLRALDPEDSYSMLAKIYTSISEGLRRLSVQVKILLDITSGIGQASENSRSTPSFDGIGSPRQSIDKLSPGLSVQAEVQQALDLSSLLGEAVDSVQAQITKVVKVRSQQTAELPVTDFLRFFTLHRLFIDECEAISGRSGTALKSVVDSQIKEFVSQFGNEQTRHLVEVMNSDKWDAKDFGEHDTAILARVIDGMSSDAPSWSEALMIWQSRTNGVNGTAANGISATGGKEKVRSAVIDEQRFILTGSATTMLRSIEAFEHLTAGVPSLGYDIAMSLAECLKFFNSRVSQLILGAGATRSAGLKNITTKHLALSSQTLSFIIALIPYVREFFRRHLPNNPTTAQAMGEFDKVKRLFQEQQGSVHEKMVEIMSGRATMHINVMKRVDWEAAAGDKTGPPVSVYVEMLMKETNTLQKVLAKHLSDPVMETIMRPVFASYREQWAKAYRDATVKSLAAKERMLVDAEFFSARISKLEGAGDLGEYIVNIVKAKHVEPTGEPKRMVDEANKELAKETTAATPTAAPSEQPEMT